MERIDATMHNFITWMINTFGYSNTVHLKDFFTFLSGAIFSALLLLLFIANTFLKIERVSTEITFLKMELKGKILFIANPHTFLESLETIIMAMILRFSKKKTIHIKTSDAYYNRALFLFITIIIIIIFSAIFGIALITLQIPDNYGI